MQLSLNNFEYSLFLPFNKIVGTLQPFVIRSQIFPSLFMGKIIKFKVEFDVLIRIVIETNNIAFIFCFIFPCFFAHYYIPKLLADYLGSSTFTSTNTELFLHHICNSKFFMALNKCMMMCPLDFLCPAPPTIHRINM